LSLVPPTASRVPEHTAVHINRQIERETTASVRTAGVIDQERYARQALRGEFDRFASGGSEDALARARHAPDAVRACAH
jgi:hypothetical protein